ncbi:aminoacyltransferase [Bifidobacterium eulemuris]|uniref:Aminoacyltransferase n=1 Tax=Bifidobacterium eulemuris TaxID=1765219 RepID=A0A261G5P3_9BIFI|nr:aminoacyltransferase [Bifidobacterium eulemuris]OZG66523.1 FemAB protein involved in pentaglycine interpeptide bridge formation in peptidoglycan [Bifidobacterium eulemuris]QOL32614.1 aminoacyltransferase [Bifidobacterium eulemuris]
MAQELSIGTISRQELDALSETHPLGNFQQTSYMIDLSSRRADSYDIVGVRRDGEVVAGCFISYLRGRMGLEGSIWCGPMCDFHDFELTAALTEAIRRSARGHGALSVSCWPDFVYQRHSSDGSCEGDADDVSFESLRRLGWRHGGFTVGYDSICNRWVYVKDLNGLADEKALLESYTKYRRKNIRIARDSHVVVRALQRDEMSLFVELCAMSSQKQHFEGRSVDYYENLYDAFGDQVQFLVAELHLNDYICECRRKLSQEQEVVDSICAKGDEASLSDKVRNRLEAKRKEVDGARRRIEEAERLIAEDGEVVPVGCIVYLRHARELVGLSAGNNDKYAKFYGSALLHHSIMVEGVERGIGRYNFYGITGNFDTDDPGYGVYDFKTRFNGFVEEMPGEFTLPVDKLRFGVKEFASKLLRR